nr:unnamed protein product [Callosobruchus chinensis]
MCVKKSNNSRVEVIKMNLSNFHDFRDFSSRLKMNKITPKPYLANFVEVQFTRGSKNLCYRTKFGEEPVELNYLMAKYFKETLPKPTVRLAPRGVDKVMKTKLLQTLPAIVQPNRLQFWKDLLVAEGPATDSGSLKESNNNKCETTFSFLKCPQRLVRWLNAIPRKNWTPSKSSVVCAKHFSERDKKVPLAYPKLCERAIPRNFPNLPKYLSSDPPRTWADQEKRRENLLQCDKKVLEFFLIEDKLTAQKNRCRWMQANPSSWCRNVEKKKMFDCLPYKTKKQRRPAKAPKPVNCETCKYKCSSVFDEEDRLNICKYFWGLSSYTRQKDFILKFVDRKQPSRPGANVPLAKRRKCSRACYFMKKETKHRVCQMFFKKTLNITNGTINKAFEGCQDDVLTADDRRHRKTPHNKTMLSL